MYIQILKMHTFSIVCCFFFVNLSLGQSIRQMNAAVKPNPDIMHGSDQNANQMSRIPYPLLMNAEFVSHAIPQLRSGRKYSDLNTRSVDSTRKNIEMETLSRQKFAARKLSIENDKTEVNLRLNANSQPVHSEFSLTFMSKPHSKSDNNKKRHAIIDDNNGDSNDMYKYFNPDSSTAGYGENSTQKPPNSEAFSDLLREEYQIEQLFREFLDEYDESINSKADHDFTARIPSSENMLFKPKAEKLIVELQEKANDEVTTVAQFQNEMKEEIYEENYLAEYSKYPSTSSEHRTNAIPASNHVERKSSPLMYDIQWPEPHSEIWNPIEQQHSRRQQNQELIRLNEPNEISKPRKTTIHVNRVNEEIRPEKPPSKNMDHHPTTYARRPQHPKLEKPKENPVPSYGRQSVRQRNKYNPYNKRRPGFNPNKRWPVHYSHSSHQANDLYENVYTEELSETDPVVSGPLTVLNAHPSSVLRTKPTGNGEKDYVAYELENEGHFVKDDKIHITVLNLSPQKKLIDRINHVIPFLAAAGATFLLPRVLTLASIRKKRSAEDKPMADVEAALLQSQALFASLDNERASRKTNSLNNVFNGGINRQN